MIWDRECIEFVIIIDLKKRLGKKPEGASIKTQVKYKSKCILVF